jgi:hypothetical protein
MGKRVLILILFSAIHVLRIFSQDSGRDRLRRIIMEEGQAEVTVPYTDKKSAEILTRNVSILSVRDNEVHISLSRLTVEWFIQQNYDYRIVDRILAKGIVSAVNINQTLLWENYPTYSQYDSIMRSFEKLYPALCHLDTIGKSINGKLVFVLKISKNPGIAEVEPAVFYSSTMHGDETGGFILMLHLADYLLKNYPVNTRVKNLVDNLEIWINPLANPDGTYGTGNIMSSPVRYNANGYDLNRNFPDPITPNTVRQKETVDMIKFMRKHKFALSANFHSGEEVVNYPWDRWLSKIHADNSWFNSISRAYADTVHLYSGPGYMNFLNNGVTRGADWYLVYGGRQDFMTWALHGREVTIELDDQFITPAAQLTLLWQNNWHSLLGYLENALYGIHGLVRKTGSHIPVPAKIFIRGHDKDSSQVYSDTLTGSFVRFLSPGSWNLTFSATGYRDTTIYNVVVVSRQKTDLTVDMSPGPDAIEKVNASIPIILYPNPSRNSVSAKLPENLNGIITISIINQTGQTMKEYNAEVSQGIPLVIYTKSLSAGIYSIILSDGGRRLYQGRIVVIK